MRFWLFIGLLLLAMGFVLAPNAQAQESEGWISDWAVEEGFSISIDTEGYAFPSAIAFVPEPGDAPDDVLYFVNELDGVVKAVTNDRSVHVFATDFFALGEEHASFESVSDEYGLTGLCLAPEQGYVFVTYTYRAEDGLLRNSIARFETGSPQFAREAKASLVMAEFLAEFPTGPSHQIGPCQVVDDALYVSVGDGLDWRNSRDIENPLGKILRFTLDGEAHPENPFYLEDDKDKPADYVYAYGVRNPFGLKGINGRLFAADNGEGIDRFVEIEGGVDYLWNGSDLSIGAGADYVFAPAVGPAQLDYIGAPGIFPESNEEQFYLALSGWAGIYRFGSLGTAGFDNLPEVFLRYRGESINDYSGIVVGLAFGPDGLYFSPLLPNGHGSAAVYVIRYEPENQHPYFVGTQDNPEILMRDSGCLACHLYNEQGGTVGPSLDQADLVPRIQERLASETYLQSLDDVDALDSEPYNLYAGERQEIRELQGYEQLRAWMIYHLLEPKFDNLNAAMPNPELSLGEVELLTDFLIGEPQAVEQEQTEEIEEAGPQGEEAVPVSFRERMQNLVLEIIPELRYRHILIAFGAGGVVGIVLYWVARRFRNR